jgi:hypothetical protein
MSQWITKLAFLFAALAGGDPGEYGIQLEAATGDSI